VKIINNYESGNIQILGFPRMGTTYLANLLFYSNETPDILISEPFNKYQILYKKKRKPMEKIKVKKSCHGDIFEGTIIDNLNTYIDDVSEIIVKNHFNKNIIKMINDDSFYNIFIFRKNLFETSLSLSLAKITGIWNSYHEKRYMISNYMFKSIITTYLNQYLLYLKIITIHLDAIVFYEDFTFDPVIDLKKFNLTCSNDIYENFDEEITPKQHVIINYNRLKKIYYDYVKDINIPGITIDGEIIHLDKFKEYE